MRRPTLIVTITILILFIAVTHAQTGQIYFKFEIASRDELGKLTGIISIDNVKDNTVYAYATDKQFDYFRTLGYDYTILPSPGSLISPRMADSREAILDWDSYPTYGGYVSMMYRFEIDYPNLCIIENIGYSVEGREILFARLSANVDFEEDEPEVMYSSTMHGDETTGYVLMLRLIDYLLSNYGSDPQVTNILDSMEVWINPLANPDGTYYGGDHTVEDAIRYNVNWVDLNRNFPDPDEGPHPDGNSWQPETIAMMNFFDRHSFIISANFHGGAEVVNYPWDTWPQRHADDVWFIQICREYADSAQANSPPGYMTDLNNGITNGWDWYTIAGGRQDYLNYWKGCRETTIELSHIKLLPPEQLPAHWDYNRAAFLTYWEQAYYGIRGIVTDAVTGLPVAAIISVIDHDIDSSEVYTDPDVGDYHRMIEAGTYDLRFIAPGYITQIVYGVPVTFRNVTIVDVQLQPVPDEPMLEFHSHDAGVVNVGDTVSMSITLINNGGGNAYDVNAILSTADSNVTILQPGSAYPTIQALGGTGTSYTEYQFAVYPDCPDFHMVDFQLAITASGGYSTTIHFDLIVGERVIIFSDDFSSNQGWTGLGGPAEWTIGVATGGYGSDSHGGPDPSEDHSPSDDNQVLGNDLMPGSGGDYNPNISETYWATSPIIDCTDYTGVIMTYYHWLGVERNLYDHAYLQVYDGTNWITLFENPSDHIDESSWNEETYDLSDIADENPSFQIRFGLGITDHAWEYCGWNIDDITLVGYFHGTVENPEILLSPTSITDSLSQYSQSIHVITIYNMGDGTLSVSFSTEDPWIQFNCGPYYVDPEDSAVLQVTLNTNNLPPGDYNGSIDFTSNDPDNPSGNIPVSLHVLAPDISFSPTSISDSLHEDSLSLHDITIYNTGEGILSVTFSTEDSWIQFDGGPYFVEPADSTVFQVTLNATDLSPGNYNGSIDFTSNDPDTLSGNIPVSLHIYEPDISVDPTVLTDTLDQGQQSTHYIYIENNGPGWLDYTVSYQTANLLSPGDGHSFLAKTDNINKPLETLNEITGAGNNRKNQTGTEPINLPATLDRNMHVVYNAEHTSDNMVFELLVPTWLTVFPLEGSVEPGGRDTLEVTLDATDLEDGEYSGQISIDSNDPDTPTLDIPVTLIVEYTPPGCDYVPGDVNGDGNVMGNDVTFGVRYFKGLGTSPPDSCWNDSTESWLYSGGDANGNCLFTGADVTFLVAYFKGYNPSILWCPQTPPLEGPLSLTGKVKRYR